MSAASPSSRSLRSSGATPFRAARAALPRPTMLRLVGGAREQARKRLEAPLGASFDTSDTDAADVDGCAVALGPDDVVDLASVARALPDPATLEPEMIVVVLGRVASARSLFGALIGALGRGPSVDRALRCSALVARGFVRVGAGTDEAGADLAWGYVPSRVTEPC